MKQIRSALPEVLSAGSPLKDKEDIEGHCNNMRIRNCDFCAERRDGVFIAFPAAAARAWNSLPCHVRDMPSLLAFRRELKTVLFRLSYPVD